MIFHFEEGDWKDTHRMSSFSFICWNCNKNVASEKGYSSYYRSSRGELASILHICPNCNAPNVQDEEANFILSPLIGTEIKNLSKLIETNYNEIRKCMQARCFNAAIMLMRKMIMHIAVEEGDKEGKNFIVYVDFLCNQGIVPKKSRSKAESVKDIGNSANHEIEDKTEEEAKNCFEFIELLLKVNYEFADKIEPQEKLPIK